MAHDEFPKWDYNEYPKTLPPDDLWGQVRRTVYGKAISEDQIQLIVDAIVAGLEIPPARALLDIGCGNAALSERLFPHCDQCLGVDASEYLISVANARFASPRHRFICQDALEYVEKETEPLAFDKVLCFAVLPYLSDENAERLLTTLARRFQHVRSVFVGNLPDPNCVFLPIINPIKCIFVDENLARTRLTFKGATSSVRWPRRPDGAYASKICRRRSTKHTTGTTQSSSVPCDGSKSWK